jgi:hypothetical protein
MAKFRVVVSETQHYEVYVEAPNDLVAERIALETYGSDGEICDTDVEATEIDEEEKEND